MSGAGRDSSDRPIREAECSFRGEQPSNHQIIERRVCKIHFHQPQTDLDVLFSLTLFIRGTFVFDPQSPLQAIKQQPLNKDSAL